MLTRVDPGNDRGIALSRTFYSSLTVSSSLGSARRELFCSQKDGTGATSYASLAARSSAESVGPKTTPATSRSVGAGGSVRLANRFALLSDDSIESSVRSDGNNPDLTKVTHAVDVHLSPVSPKALKGLIKRQRGSAESIDLAQPKQSKVFTGARDRESSRNRSATVAPTVSLQPSVTLFVSDRASCDEDVLAWSRLMILSQPSLVDPLCRKVQSNLTLVLR
ncbi:hypothetical protein E2C01_061448 [Portunus trituberculatus]|uniref:Uncharacterized protein n=1 Tax=Portunus trituberculatus TaxID=210409 RepID=A0A5B7HCF7_PORTR|nr:hypothetical protein [Portunus trituberculatus]